MPEIAAHVGKGFYSSIAYNNKNYEQLKAYPKGEDEKNYGPSLICNSLQEFKKKMTPIYTYYMKTSLKYTVKWKKKVAETLFCSKETTMPITLHI